MKTKKINGTHLHKMLLNGLNLLSAEEEKINDLNVFPVPDGDTGTNMRLTLLNGLKKASEVPQAGAYLKGLSEGMLLGARGNSGVILSQLFKGIFTELQHDWAVNPAELYRAFVSAYKTAYQAVVRPVEGTILTVAREGAENIRAQIDKNISIEELLSVYIAEMKKSLAMTPELLPCLKEAGVVDSGAVGYITIVEGMLKYLYGEIIETGAETETFTEKTAPDADSTLFNENSVFEDGYCVEFILQRMKDPKYVQLFREESFIEDLKAFGNSLVVIRDGSRVKVHVHTMKPSKILAMAQEYGEFLTVKVENMQIQHNEHLKKTAEKKLPHRTISVLPVVNGEGMKNIFSELGCDIVLQGGPTMNTSSEEFVEAFRRIDAEAIVVLPNNKNVIRAAEQAVGLFQEIPVTVLPTKSVMEGYYAIAMDVADSEDISFRLSQMRAGMERVRTVQVAKTTRDYKSGELQVPAGAYLSISDGEPVSSADRPEEAVISALEKLAGIEELETCLVFTGEDVSDEDQERLTSLLEEHWPLLEVTVLPGGQKTYSYILGLL